MKAGSTVITKPKSVQVGINVGFLQLAGTWEPNDAERQAAWELYIELITRVAVVPLPAGQGLLREALTSLYSLFETTRQVLRAHGPHVAEPRPEGQYSLGHLAVAILNLALRPVLASWHPLLEEWEATRPPDRSHSEHERAWPHAAQLREDLDHLRTTLAQWASLLAAANGIPDLTPRVTPPVNTAPSGSQS